VAYALTAAILFVVANIFPIVTIEAQGHHTATTLLGTVFALYEQNMMTVGGLVFITTILVPALEIGVMLYVLLSLKAGGKGTQRAMPVSLRLGQTVRPWGMLEVFVLGTIVSLVKLAHLATVVPGIGLWSLGAMMICLAAMAASFDSHSLWEAIGGSYDS
jgi:paraquat-inducible protein A